VFKFGRLTTAICKDKVISMTSHGDRDSLKQRVGTDPVLKKAWAKYWAGQQLKPKEWR
jgi:hypothetical protein